MGAALFLSLVALTSSTPASIVAAPAVVVVGHRGAPAARPENTVAGFAYAFAHGADAVELDVRTTSDGVLVVIHDAAVPGRCRGSGERRVRALSFSAVERFDCGAADPAFPRQQPVPGARIPALDDVLALAPAGAPSALFIELKADDVDGRDVPILAGAVSAALARHALTTRVIVESFDEGLVRALAQADARVPRGLLVDGNAGVDGVARAFALGARVLSPASSSVDATLVALAHAHGQLLVPYTVNDEGTWQRLARIGVDAIVTDDPAGLAGSAP
ncbi:MAG TPA: glycerophosphodiester phosphodiesterase family protein [Myxococcota bacterium]|jgi:glycerophosphoryl diester phosphodiesterase